MRCAPGFVAPLSYEGPVYGQLFETWVHRRLVRTRGARDVVGVEAVLILSDQESRRVVEAIKSAGVGFAIYPSLRRSTASAAHLVVLQSAAFDLRCRTYSLTESARSLP